MTAGDEEDENGESCKFFVLLRCIVGGRRRWNVVHVVLTGWVHDARRP